MTYSYYEESNKLKNVDGSTTENYTYDQIGNLVSDTEEGITNIEWTPYGKVRKVVKDDNSEVSFRYDASGNRIAKITDSDTTIYVRDASGNVMGVYNNKALKELAIYGSSRLGLINFASQTGYRTLGGKKYELSNHLGNVLAVVSENIHLDQDSTWTTVINTTDYYPFGLAMDGRTVQDSTYRYGFTGHEKDDEIKGPGRHLSFGYFGYDPRLGRRWNVDPLANKFPSWSPFTYSLNNPLRYNDPDGKAPWDIIVQGQNNSSILIKTDLIDVAVDASFLQIDFGGNYSVSGTDAVITGLDIVGVFDPTGVADGLAATLSFEQGDYWGGAASIAGLIPLAGDAAKIPKIAKGVDKIMGSLKTAENAKALAKQGRSGKQARLRELADDPKVGSADRGWIKNEMRHIETGNRKTIRNPRNSRARGTELAHPRGKRAKDGHSYKDAKLQDVDLHKLEHKHGGY